MKRSLILHILLCMLATPTQVMPGLSWNIELIYEFDTIWELGDLTVKEFEIGPSKTSDITSHDVALFSTFILGKTVARQINIVTKKDQHKIDLLKKERQALNDQLVLARLFKRKKELEQALMQQKELNKKTELNAEKESLEKEIRTKLQRF